MRENTTENNRGTFMTHHVHSCYFFGTHQHCSNKTSYSDKTR